MTANEIASSIRARVADGLSGNISDQAFSLQQLLAEIDLVRNDFIHKYSNTNKLDPKYLVQEPAELFKIECRNLSPDCRIKGFGEEIPSIKIPKIIPTFGDYSIEYLGLNNMQESFAVYYHPDDIRNHKVRIKTKNLPYAWVDLSADVDDLMTVFLFNLGKYNSLQFLKVRGIYENPTRVNRNNPDALDMEYPAPGHLQNSIIDALTEKYVRYFRQLNTPQVPNTQADSLT